MSPFSALTLSTLSRAGWSAERTIDTHSYRLCLTAEEYVWFDSVATFLSKYGGLTLNFRRQGGQPDTVHFDACQASAGVDPRWVLDDYAPRIGNPLLCVIGAAYSNHLLLFMDNTGRVYGGYDEFLCEVADSGPEAIEAIVTNHIHPEIQ